MLFRILLSGFVIVVVAALAWRASADGGVSGLPNTGSGLLLLFGLLMITSAVVGGGWQLAAVNIPRLNPPSRAAAAVIGLAFMYFGLVSMNLVPSLFRNKSIPPPPPPLISLTDYGIQVGAFADWEQFNRAIAAARASAASELLLKARPTMIPYQGQSGDIVLYRARLMGLSAAAAQEACERLKQAKLDCIVVSPTSAPEN
jgi:hypothetical protein